MERYVVKIGFTVLWYSATLGLSLSALVISPKGPIIVDPGSRLSINCTVISDSEGVSPLTWHHQPLNGEVTALDPQKFQEDWITGSTFAMTIKKVDLKDTGIYICRSQKYGVQNVTVVVKKDTLSGQCTGTQYRCPDGRCIFQRYRCDFVTDCSDGSDEKDCDNNCEGKFQCASGQCINRTFVCDGFRSFDCRDGSDERDCGRIKYGEDEIVVTETTPGHHGHGMHFNAIYTGVASVIGVVCVVAIIVITICRIHMKRESIRSRHLVSCGGSEQCSHRSTNSVRLPSQQRTSPRQPSSQPLEALEAQQELTVLSHGFVPNVTVNVNLQVSPERVPLFACSVVKPPPYSEFGPPSIDEQPPPPYTTLP